MKKIFLFFLLSFPATLLCQINNPTLSELKGMEDLKGNTHLFYRMDSSWGDYLHGGFSNSIYHFDLSDESDSLFLYAGVKRDSIYQTSIFINDIEFWHNDPTKYIYVGVGCYTECGGFIKRSDSQPLNSSFMLGKISISASNDSAIFSSASCYIIKSTDGGKNWLITDSTDYLNFLSLSPYYDNYIFALDSKGYIEKSSDGGKTFFAVDTSLSSLEPNIPVFYYDRDSLHFYRISYFSDDEKIMSYGSISKSQGEINSWSKIYSSENNLYMSVDYSNSGIIYLADGKNILLSTNYGNTFALYKSLDSTVVGIYKKQGSDKLYAATKYDIYEITPSSIKSIKHLLTSVSDKNNKILLNFSLNQNYPNPFNPSTTITYEIPKAGSVQLKIYNILGQEISTLVNEIQTVGKHSVLFNAQQTIKQFSSGIYFYRLKFGNNILNKKMILLR
jgi:hypothetical protein